MSNFQLVKVSKVTHSQAKAAAHKAGIPLKQWLGLATIHYIAQTDPAMERQFAKLYNALDGFARGEDIGGEEVETEAEEE